MQDERDHLTRLLTDDAAEKAHLLQRIPKANERIAQLQNIIQKLHNDKARIGSLRDSLLQALGKNKNTDSQQQSTQPAVIAQPKAATISATINLPRESSQLERAKNSIYLSDVKTVHVPYLTHTDNTNFRNNNLPAFALTKRAIDYEPMAPITLPARPNRVVDNLIGSLQLMNNPASSSDSNPMTASFSHNVHVMAATAANSDRPKTATDKGFDKITEHFQMDSTYANYQILLGQKYAQKIISGRGIEEIPTRTQSEYLKSIIALNWFFYDDALREEKGFDEGTFIIEDKNSRLYDFFMGYVQK